MSYVEAKSYISRYKKSLDRPDGKIPIDEIPGMLPICGEFNSNLPTKIINSAAFKEEYKKAAKYYGKEGIFSLVYKLSADSDFVTGLYIYHYLLKPLLAGFSTLDTTICSYHIGVNKVGSLDGINYIIRQHKYLSWQWKGQDSTYLRQLNDRYLHGAIKDVNNMNVNTAAFTIATDMPTKLLFITSDVSSIDYKGLTNIICLSLRCLDKRGFGLIRISKYNDDIAYLIAQLLDFYEQVAILRTSWTSTPKYYLYYSQLQYRDVETLWRNLVSWQKKRGSLVIENKDCDISGCALFNDAPDVGVDFIDIYFNGE